MILATSKEAVLYEQAFYRRQLAFAVRAAVSEWFNLDQFGRPSLLDTIDTAINRLMNPSDCEDFDGEAKSNGKVDFVFAPAEEAE